MEGRWKLLIINEKERVICENGKVREKGAFLYLETRGHSGHCTKIPNPYLTCGNSASGGTSMGPHSLKV